VLNNLDPSVALPAGGSDRPTTTASEPTPAATPLHTGARTGTLWQTVLATVVIALAVWWPRAFQLDHFVTIDESKWLVRSANFYNAIAGGDFAEAFQHGHPGVMVMYAGMAGYLWAFPDYITHVEGSFPWGDEFMAMIDDLGHPPIEMLAMGRTFIVLFNVLFLTLAFGYARRLVGLWPAFIAFMLIAFDPFHVALSRFLHPDSLLSTLMLLAALAFMAYLWAGRRTVDLVATGIFTALALLNKTPAIFLVPLVGLLTLIDLAVYVTGRAGWRVRDFITGASLWRMARTWLIWGGVTALVYVALWPAMWVNAQWTLTQVLDISGDYATQGHSSPVFFNGHIYNGDPGVMFYPINYLWRTTPIVMLGLLALGGLLFWRSSFLRRREVWLTLLGLVLMAFFFNIFMTLAAKKFDRYLLPVFPPLDLVAGLGWAALLGAMAAIPRPGWPRKVGLALVSLALLVQIGLTWQTFPYYMSYYNPVMGGPTQAENVMFIGWGEGLDEAARYLNRTVDLDTVSVASWYERGPFSFFYDGPTQSNRYIWDSDYSVIYNHQFQRELPNRRMMAYFDTQTPIHTVDINGIDYVQIFDNRQAPDTDYVVEWGDQIRLVYYDTFSGAMYPGQRFDMTAYYVKTAPIETNYSLKLRLVNDQGHELLVKEGWPAGVALSQWDANEVLRDNTVSVRIPEGTPPGLYRIELSWYDPDTFDHLTGIQVKSGNPVPDPYVLDYLIVGDWPPPPRVELSPPVALGDQVTLYGAALLDADGSETPWQDQAFAPGASFDLRLHWRAERFIHTDYTTFVHVIGPDGRLVTQGDDRPLDGFIPTSYWPPRQTVADDYTLTLPADAPAGDYRVVVGWYDLVTDSRLPITRAGQSLGDAFEVGTFTVR
jgi:hypothetical protein